MVSYSTASGAARNLPALVVAVLALASPGLSAQDTHAASRSTGIDRHIDVSDPPPFVILRALGPGGSPVPRGDTTECPAFVFRNHFDPGYLSQTGGAGTPIQYVTTGGYVVKVDLHTISIQDPYARNKVEHWGDPHENLNGKHIKDWGGAEGWEGTRRSILLGDNTKVTMEATGAQGVVLLTSVYDAHQNVQIDNAANLILHHGTDSADADARDAAQFDGETALFTTDAQTSEAYYDNVYNEDADFQFVPFDTPLGKSGGCANPNTVNDYFDDPRLGHT